MEYLSLNLSFIFWCSLHISRLRRCCGVIVIIECFYSLQYISWWTEALCSPWIQFLLYPWKVKSMFTTRLQPISYYICSETTIFVATDIRVLRMIIIKYINFFASSKYLKWLRNMISVSNMYLVAFKWIVIHKI